MRCCRLLLFCIACMPGPVVAAPLVFSGHVVEFSKDPTTNDELPANQDALSPDVVLTRGLIQGLFNIAQESSYTSKVSPAGTLWAFEHNNPGVVVEASNWAALNFADWETAFGGAPAGGPQGTIGQNSVVFLVANNSYADYRLTDWGIGIGGAGSFAVSRAFVDVTIPEPASLILLAASSLCGIGRRSRRAD